MITLVLFDIDGTLVLTGGAGLRAMALAFEELFGVPDAFRGMQMAGRTDAWILSDAVAMHGIPQDSSLIARFPDVYVRHLAVEIEKPHPRKLVMPGIPALLDALSRRADVYLALATGNFETAARLKLEHFDLWRYFPCGAFGDAAPSRNGLVPKAIARIAAQGGPVFTAADAVVIGDTPLDVACAHAVGARAIGVATGPHGADELRQAGAHEVFADLSDTQRVIEAIRS